MDVEELLISKKITYVPKGADFEIACLNPEHPDNTPSTRVDRITGIFHCFSCGFKGNLFTFFEAKANFLQQKRAMLKKKIREKVAENIGLEMPKNAVQFNKEWRNISPQSYNDFEAFEHHDKDFIGRVIFPIRSLAGRIVGFNARSMSPSVEPRYLISPAGAKFPLYPAKVNPIRGRVILVEGLFDMLNLYDKGLTNAVCAFGTQKVTKEKLQILKIQGVTGIDIMFDGDEAGAEAATKVEELAAPLEIDTRVITLKSGDPGELTALKVLKLKEKLYGEDSPSRDEANQD